jgi:acyl-CoA reductase-like NAD-dependent aldehyde dehydrogenase
VAPDETRRAACHAIVSKIEEHAEDPARLLTLEQGKPLNGLGSHFEIGGVVAWTRYTADLKLDAEVLQDTEAGRIELHRKPIGVVGSITPWNWPLLIASWHIVPAVRTGNTVVIKPSPHTPLSTLRMVELMNEVLPPGVVNAVSGEDSLGAAMSAHPGIHKMVFTGSSRTGRQVMQAAAPTLKRLTLELGGNDAGIVLPDADPKAIAPGLFWGAFINGGQTCAALKRLYVHESIYERVCEELGVPGLADDPRFKSNGDRLANRDALNAIISDKLAVVDGMEFALKLLRAGLPCGPVLDTAQVLAHPHAAARGMVVEKDGYKGTGTPIKFSRTPGSVKSPPPRFSQHTREVLKEHGFDDAAIEKLTAAGVLVEKRRV